MTGGIDKLDLRIPGGAELQPKFEGFLTYMSRCDPSGRVYATKLYEKRAEFGRHGCKWNVSLKNRRDGNHKLELIGVGSMTLKEMKQEISQVFDVDTDDLGILRIDVCADVVGYPVDWFYENARLRHKRNDRQWGQFQTEHRKLETLYFGQRPNLFRVYDRIGCLRDQYRRLKSRRDLNEKVPTFEELYGYPEEGVIITRTERQYGGGKIPAQIRTIHKLQENATRLNPFEPMQFLPFAMSDGSLNDLTGNDFIRAHGFLRLLENHGYQRTKQILDRKTGRNTGRLFTQLAKSVASDETNRPPDLDAIFQQAVSQQLTG